ncbi:MFS transporter [Streptomyces sp. NPDC002402]
MVNNLNDALAWGIFSLLFAAHGLSIAQIGILAALYPAVWGAEQMLTGWWSDHIGRKHLITAGMLLQAAAIALVAAGTAFGVWVTAQVLLGIGTALVRPTLLAVIGDVAHPTWRARAVGVYRLWRDGGFAVGALLAGVLGDAYGLTTAIWAIAALTAHQASWERSVCTRPTHATDTRAAPTTGTRLGLPRPSSLRACTREVA